MFRYLAAILAVFSVPAFAQKDFLTADEVDQVRLVQEPNERVQLYLMFAKQRMSRISQMMAQNKPGRSKFIHDLLEEYTQIVEAIDVVSDDAIRRGIDITIGAKFIADAGKETLGQLEKLRDDAPADLQRYQFALDQAIEATEDSTETASSDLTKRSAEIQNKVKADQKQRESLMRPDELKQKQETVKKETETKKKVPTLRRKDEVVPEK